METNRDKPRLWISIQKISPPKIRFPGEMHHLGGRRFLKGNVYYVNQSEYRAVYVFYNSSKIIYRSARHLYG